MKTKGTLIKDDVPIFTNITIEIEKRFIGNSLPLKGFFLIDVLQENHKPYQTEQYHLVLNDGRQADIIVQHITEVADLIKAYFFVMSELE